MTPPALVSCTCNSCAAVLCISANDWSEFTSSYASYNAPQLFSHAGLEQVDQNRPGLKDSELEGCTVQALQCLQCHDLVGVKCVDATPDKEQYRDQSFLKLEKMTLKLISNGQTVSPKIGPRIEATVDTPQARRTGSKKDSLRHRNGVRTTKASADIDPPIEEANLLETVRRQDRELKLIFRTLESLQQEIYSLANFVEESVRDQRPSIASPSALEDVQLLADNVTDVNRRLGELDSFQLQMKLMQSDIRRLKEDRRKPTLHKESLALPPVPAQKRKLSDGARGAKTASREPKEKRLPRPSPEDPGLQIDPSLVEQFPSTSRSSTAQPAEGASLNGQTKGRPRFHQEAERRRSNLHQTITALQESMECDSPTPTHDAGFDDEVYGGHGDYEGESTDFISEADELDNANDGDSPPAAKRQRLNRHIPRLSPPTPEGDGPEYPSPPSGRRNRHPGADAFLQRQISSDLTHPPPSANFRQPAQSQPLGTSTSSSNKNSKKSKPLRVPATLAKQSHYNSIWTPEERHRGVGGLMITRDGRIDGRSLRFEGKGHYKRDGPRDEEGYLLRADGNRDKRSVRIINGMKQRREARAREQRGLGGGSGETINGIAAGEDRGFDPGRGSTVSEETTTPVLNGETAAMGNMSAGRGGDGLDSVEEASPALGYGSTLTY